MSRLTPVRIAFCSSGAGVVAGERGLQRLDIDDVALLALAAAKS
jgi:hypothetical protein